MKKATSDSGATTSLTVISSVMPPFIGASLIAALKQQGISLSVLCAHSISEYSALRRRFAGGLLRHFIDIKFSVSVLCNRAFRRIACNEAIDVVTTNPWYLPFPVILINKLRGIKTCFFVLDLYPDALIAGEVMIERGVIARILRASTTFSMRLANRTVFLGESLKAHAEQRYAPIASAVVCLGPSEELQLVAANHSATRSQSELVAIVYSGNIGPLHDSDTVRRSLELLALKPAATGNPTVHIVARGAHAEKIAPSDYADFILKHEPLESKTWSELMSQCRVSIVTLKSGAETVSFPSKVWSAIAAGHAIIVVAQPDSDLVRLVTEYNLGWSLRNGDSEGLAELVRSLSLPSDELNVKQENAVKYAASFLTADQLANEWRSAFTDF